MYSDYALENFETYICITPKSFLGKTAVKGAYDSPNGRKGHGFGDGRLRASDFERGGRFDFRGRGALDSSDPDAARVDPEAVLKFIASKLSRGDWGGLYDCLTGKQAMDASAHSDAVQALQEFLQANLPAEAMSDCNRLVENVLNSMNTGGAEDDGPKPFPVMPLRGGGRVPGERLEPAMDSAAVRSFEEAFPNASRVKVHATANTASTRSLPTKAVTTATFDAMFPAAAKVRAL